jgi:hypothetical protein
MAHVNFPEHDLPESLFLIDASPTARRFLFDDRLLPPITAPPRRTQARIEVSRIIRATFQKHGILGLPVGNLLDIAPDADGWRAV